MYDKAKQLWIVALNKYQRDNLLWLLRMVGGYTGQRVKPFEFANSGDWVGEVTQELENLNDFSIAPISPNTTNNAVQESIYRWIGSSEATAIDIALKLDNAEFSPPLFRVLIAG